MPYDYNQSPIPYLPSNYNPYIPYDSKTAKWGLIIGSLLSGGLGAAGGQNTGDAILRGAAGGLVGLGQGANFLQNWNTQAIDNDRVGNLIKNQMLDNELARKRYDMDVEQWQTMKPYYEGLTQSRTPSLTDQMLGRKRERQELRGQSLQNKKLEKELREGKPDTSMKEATIRDDVAREEAAIENLYGTLRGDKTMGIPIEDTKEMGRINNEIARRQKKIEMLQSRLPDYLQAQPQAQNQQVQQTDDIALRFQSDPQMQGATLGKKTENGYEVYQNGKLVGHYK